MASPNTKRNVDKTGADLYNTPVEALDALYSQIWLYNKTSIFEPCNGIGNVSNYFKNKGLTVITNELYDYSIETDFKEDFLSPDVEASKDWDYDIIISNPPYKQAVEFILEGFKYSRKQYLFLRLDFLTSKSRKSKLFNMGYLKTVYIFSYRVSCSKGVDEEPQANATNYAWFEFDKEYVGNPTIIWL